MQVECAAPRRSHSHWFGKCRDANPGTSWLAFLKVRHVWHFVRNWTWDWCKLMDRFKVQVNKSFREPVTAANRIIVLNVGEVRLLGLKKPRPSSVGDAPMRLGMTVDTDSINEYYLRNRWVFCCGIFYVSGSRPIFWLIINLLLLSQRVNISPCCSDQRETRMLPDRVNCCDCMNFEVGLNQGDL